PCAIERISALASTQKITDAATITVIKKVRRIRAEKGILNFGRNLRHHIALSATLDALLAITAPTPRQAYSPEFLNGMLPGKNPRLAHSRGAS
ncbi:MAG: hypothetical protein ACRETL_05910, partial [Gammaproteobacteria bacterium]